VVAGLWLALALGLSQLAPAEDAPLKTRDPQAATPADSSLVPLAETPLPQPSPWIPPREYHFNVFLPILEGELLHFVLAAANNLLLRESFAQISWDSTLSHFDGRRPWEFDVDLFVVNQFGHPIQGALAFTAARSSGLSFWWSALYPFLSSLAWEMFYEIDAPSYNDQVTTPMGGIFLGEVLHRSALLLLNEAGGPRWLRAIGAFVLEPMGQINRTLFNDTLDAHDVDDAPPVFGMLGGGVNLGTAYRDPVTFQVIQAFAPQGNIQGRLTYGTPGDPNFSYRAPFSHFDLDFNISFPGTPVTSFFIRGLLVGAQFAKGSTRGLWGLFGQYDFASASLLRVSSVGFGLGTSLQTRLSSDFTLQVAGLASAVPFASAGSLGFEEGLVRDYHIGPGAQLTLESRLIWRDRAWLRLVARTWFTAGLYIEPLGWESITYVTGGPLVRLFGPVALGADAVVAVRRAYFPDALFDRSVTGVTGRLTLNLISNSDFGAVRR
jgi:Domain of unknown function (DUF3943)